jgi:hypothetical protein
MIRRIGPKPSSTFYCTPWNYTDLLCARPDRFILPAAFGLYSLGSASVICFHCVGRFLWFGQSGKDAPMVMTISASQQTVLNTPKTLLISPLIATRTFHAGHANTRSGTVQGITPASRRSMKKRCVGIRRTDQRAFRAMSASSALAPVMCLRAQKRLLTRMPRNLQPIEWPCAPGFP